MTIIGIDPGTTHSGWVEMTPSGRVIAFNKEDPNDAHLESLRFLSLRVHVAIERMNYQGFGANVGQETFETCEWIGRFYEAAHPCPAVLIYRRTIQVAIGGSAKANDGAIAFALREMYGGQKASKGLKKSPGPLYGISGHAWQALAVAVAYRMQQDPAWKPREVES